jgi:hypothetical protein
MGGAMKLRLSLLDCGKCGKPRGRHHVCSGGRKGRDKLRLKAGLACGKCGRKVSNPFAHTCTVRSDFAKRKRRAARQAKAAAARDRRRKRAEEAAARRKAAARQRKTAASRKKKPRASPHNPRNCHDEECQRYPCRLYEEGFADGVASSAGSEAS